MSKEELVARQLSKIFGLDPDEILLLLCDCDVDWNETEIEYYSWKLSKVLKKHNYWYW